MKLTKKILIVGLVLCSTVVVAFAASTAGSQTDPLVTMSYVDKQIAIIKSSISEITGGSTGSSDKFTPIQLEEGKTLLAGEGTEIIPRNGARLLAVQGTDAGLADVTDGKDLKGGEVVPENHLLISARNDGRGITATKPSWIMIKGAYTLK